MTSSAAGAGGKPATIPVPTIPVICDTCRAQGAAGGEGFEQIADILSFEPVPRRTQVNNWTPELQRAFVAALAITGSERRAGKAIGRHEYGAQKLRKARGGKGFDEACEAALEIYRDREMARIADQMGELSNASIEQVQKMDLAPGESDDDPDDRRELTVVQERIRARLLRARRLYLLAIAFDEKKRAAWETLCGPVDWDKAAELKPQDNDPYQPRLQKPDMLLAAEGGCLHDMVGAGRDRVAEFREALQEARELVAKGEGPKGPTPPKLARFCDEQPEGEGSAQSGASTRTPQLGTSTRLVRR